MFGKECQMTMYTLRAKNSVEIALSCTISAIKALCFMQKFKMATENGEKTFFDKKCHVTFHYDHYEKLWHLVNY